MDLGSFARTVRTDVTDVSMAKLVNTPRTIRLDDATWKAAGKAASLEGRTVSNWVAMLIRREVKERYLKEPR